MKRSLSFTVVALALFASVSVGAMHNCPPSPGADGLRPECPTTPKMQIRTKKVRERRCPDAPHFSGRSQAPRRGRINGLRRII